jgi:putative endonuclease
MEKQFYVYILTNKPYGTLYVGVTSDLAQRIYQHREGLAEGFSKRHELDRLIWYEVHEDVTQAIAREKRIKKWHRDWKINLIQTTNPDWKDLYDSIA